MRPGPGSRWCCCWLQVGWCKPEQAHPSTEGLVPLGPLKRLGHRAGGARAENTRSHGCFAPAPPARRAAAVTAVPQAPVPPCRGQFPSCWRHALQLFTVYGAVCPSALPGPPSMHSGSRHCVQPPSFSSSQLALRALLCAGRSELGRKQAQWGQKCIRSWEGSLEWGPSSRSI